MIGRTRVKICGVRDPATAAVAAEAGADAIGLVFVPASPRCVTLEEAKRIVAQLPPFVQPVGVFVDEPVERVREVSEAVGLRTVQLHGRETPAQVAGLAPLRVIKALAFDEGLVEDEAARWRRAGVNLAGLLWDAAAPEGQTAEPSLRGGLGQRFDWRVLADLQHRRALDGLPPMILAGGLTPQNVGEAVLLLSPYAVDVSSGVELSLGVKAPELIRAFCEAVRKADANR